MREKVKQKREVEKTPVIVIIGIILIAILVVFSLIQIGRPRANSSFSSENNFEVSLPTGIDKNGFPYIGESDAPVRVVVYEDFGCHNCQFFTQNIEPDFLKLFVESGDVALISHPVAFVNQQSIPAAQAAECALEQDKFWEYRHQLFQNQGITSFTRENLVALAADANLDSEDFGTCYDLGKFALRVRERTQNAQSIGVEGTPTFLINGKLFAGVLQIDSDNPDAPGFQQIIGPLLEEKNN